MIMREKVYTKELCISTQQIRTLIFLAMFINVIDCACSLCTFFLTTCGWKLFELDVTLLIVFNQTNGHLCTHLLYKSTTSSPKIRCTTYVGYFFQISINIGHESSHQFFFYFFLFFVVHRSADLKDKLSFFTRRSMYINSSSKPLPPTVHTPSLISYFFWKMHLYSTAENS